MSAREGTVEGGASAERQIAATNDTGQIPDRTARAAVRALMRVEADLAFRRRCETIIELLDPQPGDRVLDCGCGHGFTMAVLACLTEAELVGLDPASERLADAARLMPPGREVTLVRGTAEALPFPDGSFSHAVCSEVLEHLPGDAAAARELFRVLHPGGRLVVTVPSASYPMAWDPINWWLERLTGRHLGGERPWSGIWHGHRRLYRPEELRELLTSAGFRVVEERPLSARVPPFAHLVLYGGLKPLLQRGWLPDGAARAGSRFTGDAGSPGTLIRLAMRALERIDRPNDDPVWMARARAALCLSVLAVKP